MSTPRRATGDQPRLIDVAAAAGVSMKTVSNVVNDFRHVAPATRARVQQAIDALGYRPNQSARNLARGRTGSIALVVPRLDRPYFATLAMHVIEAAARVGWTVVIEQTNGEAAAERAVLTRGSHPRLDGVILSTIPLEPEAVIRPADAVPLVLLGEQLDARYADHVAIDNVAAGRLATEHLLALGRRRIAMIGVSLRDRHNPRLRGYLEAVTAAGAAVEDRLQRVIDDHTGASGERAVADLLAEDVRPDALFCGTDWLAMGAIAALTRRGIRVPDDIAVVGFDDIPYATAIHPTVTTIAPDRPAIAELCIASLTAQLAAARDSRPHTPTEHTAAHHLIIRDSAPAPPLPGAAEAAGAASSGG